jgi:hypothetical protein
MALTEMRMRVAWAILALLLSRASEACAQAYPDPPALPPRAELPDPLTMFDGRRVTTGEQWYKERRPELKTLFQYYMYGYLPPAPQLHATVGKSYRDFLGGKAAMKEVAIELGGAGAPKLSLLVLLPNKTRAPVPVILGLDFCGNHAVVADPRVSLPAGWVPEGCAGARDNRATTAGRGSSGGWAVEQVIDRGYALAVFYHGDVAPDTPDFTRGIFPHHLKPGASRPGPHEWGAIAAWAWGLQRAVDYLVTDQAIDNRRIAVFGHSRNGKAALLAAAFDERIALALPHQSGRGGAAPSRGVAGESVKDLNARFPHWFNDTFPLFDDDTSRLPFDQHELIALMAPRPVLLTTVLDDIWEDPAGTYQVFRAANAVYRFLGVDGPAPERIPQLDSVLGGVLGFSIRSGDHSTTAADWKVFLDFADHHLEHP